MAGLLAVVLLAYETSWDAQLYLAAAQIEAFDLSSTISTLALLGLVGLWGVLALVLTARRRWYQLALLCAGGLGSVLAYGSSEALKLVFSRERPCTTFEVLAECPAAENWSFPSNHTVIAVSLMLALIAAAPRLAWAAVPLALTAGISRVFAGHHYPQDVLAGALLGLCVAFACVLLLMPLCRSAASRLSRRFPLVD